MGAFPFVPIHAPVVKCSIQTFSSCDPLPKSPLMPAMLLPSFRSVTSPRRARSEIRQAVPPHTKRRPRLR